MPQPDLALPDRSLFVAVESQPPLSRRPSRKVAVSAVTAGELRLGLSAAATGASPVRRLETLIRVEGINQLSIDSDVAHAGAALPSATRAIG